MSSEVISEVVGPPEPLATGGATPVKRTRKKSDHPIVKFSAMEMFMFNRCRDTGYSYNDCLAHDDDLIDKLLEDLAASVRGHLIQERLEQDPKWLKTQLDNLRAGVRNPGDEPEDETANSL